MCGVGNMHSYLGWDLNILALFFFIGEQILEKFYSNFYYN